MEFTTFLIKTSNRLYSFTMKNLLTVLDSINSETDKFVSVFIWLSDSMSYRLTTFHFKYHLHFIYEASRSATYDFTGNLSDKCMVIL
jgi:hypothetical protein